MKPEHAEDTKGKGPDLSLGDFEGPLDLLFFLIEKQKIDIYDIPIASVTEQYLDYLEKLEVPDLDLAADFLVMAATLLQIKSRLLLPRPSQDKEEEDPRGELVLRLLEYRRCKLLAEDLQKRQKESAGSYGRLPATAAELGLTHQVKAADGPAFEAAALQRAALRLAERNALRFQDISERLTHILRREKVSLVEKLRYIWQELNKRSRIFFTELFPYGSNRAERVTGFLALLELLRGQRISVVQEEPFALIEIALQKDQAPDGVEEESFQTWLETHHKVQGKEEYVH